MSIVQCKYCHEMVPLVTYALHVQQHERKRADGQQTDDATLPAELREEGDLEGVPRWYRHEKCGVQAGMPEDIIRTYLQNPFSTTARHSAMAAIRTFLNANVRGL